MASIGPKHAAPELEKVMATPSEAEAAFNATVSRWNGYLVKVLGAGPMVALAVGETVILPLSL